MDTQARLLGVQRLDSHQTQVSGVRYDFYAYAVAGLSRSCNHSAVPRERQGRTHERP